MPKKMHGLGRGLDALLPEDDQESVAGGITLVNIDEIDPNLEQPRKTFTPESITELAQSMESQGILQPILVVRNGERYVIVAGERRWRAAREANIREIPCIVRELDEKEQMEIALMENLQREDLNPMEQAQGVRQYMDHCSYTQEEVAKRLGRSRPAVANLLRLLSLPEEIQDMIRGGALTAGHARVLCGLETAEDQKQLAEETVEKAYSVRQLEEVAASWKEQSGRTEEPEADQTDNGAEGKGKQKVKELPLELAAFEASIRETMGVRATLKGSEKKGKIILQYYSREELEHLHDLLERLREY